MQPIQGIHCSTVSLFECVNVFRNLHTYLCIHINSGIYELVMLFDNNNDHENDNNKSNNLKNYGSE